MDDFPETDCATTDSDAADMNYLISRRLCLPPEEVSAGLDGMDDFPQTDCAAADSGTTEMNDLIFRRLSLPPDDDSAMVDYDTGAVGLDDLIFRRLRFPPEEFAGGGNTAADACYAMKFAVMIFRGTKLPPNEFSAGRNGDYIWHDLGTEPSVCNRPVTGSHGFGSSHRLDRCCLWWETLPIRGGFDGCLYTIPALGGCVLLSCGSVIIVPRWLAEHLMTWTCLFTLFCVVAFSDMCLPSGTVMIWS